jgi:hypothetical protein
VTAPGLLGLCQNSIKVGSPKMGTSRPSERLAGSPTLARTSDALDGHRPMGDGVTSGCASFVTVVQATDLRERGHAAFFWRLYAAWHGRVLRQGEMGPCVIVSRSRSENQSAGPAIKFWRSTGACAPTHLWTCAAPLFSSARAPFKTPTIASLPSWHANS